jgi:cystathionine gamma-synthase
MSSRDLLRDPCWQGSDLGHPLPDATHAVSVALPRWSDVIAYEEQDPACRGALQAVYPRFGQHPLVAELATQALQHPNVAPSNGASSWPYPNRPAAEAALAHCRRTRPPEETRLLTIHGLICLIADAGSTPAAKAFWQHTGLGASSRLAAIALGEAEGTSRSAGENARGTVIRRLEEIYGCTRDAISLHPSGMTALYRALQLVSALRPNRPVLQIGFPYVDVLKLPQVVFNGAELLLDDSAASVSDALERLQPSAVVVELPSNPLLRCVDLPTIARLAHQQGIPVIADDTIGSAINVDALPHADLVFSSLTKSFAGRGDVLAGSLVVSHHSPWRTQLAAADHALPPLALLADLDAIALEQGSEDVIERVHQLNANTLSLAERLRDHPAVAQLFHPGECQNFKTLQRPGTGHGCLLSFELQGGTPSAQRVYDALVVCKGPSLGTAFTLVCPYVLLAHYDELTWANRCGVPSHLLRVSVGLEDPNELWARFQRALENA